MRDDTFGDWVQIREGDVPKGTFWCEFEHADGSRLRIEARAANIAAFARESDGFKPGIKIQATSILPDSIPMVQYIPVDLVGVAVELMNQAAKLLRSVRTKEGDEPCQTNVWTVEEGDGCPGATLMGIYASESGALARADEIMLDPEWPWSSVPVACETGRRWERGGSWVEVWRTEVKA